MDRPALLLFTIISGIASILSFVYAVYQAGGGEPLVARLWQTGFIIPFVIFAATLWYYQRFYFGSPFKDLRTIYTIRILSPSGDCLIDKELHTAVRTLWAVSQRRHEAFSHGDPMKWDAMGLHAWDSEGHTLNVIPISDQPTHKEFAVQFFVSVRWPEKLHYTYQYRWDSFFEGNDYFCANDVCKDVTVIIVLPREGTLNSLVVREVSPDGLERELAPAEHSRDPSPQETAYMFRFAKTHRNTRLRAECVWRCA